MGTNRVEGSTRARRKFAEYLPSLQEIERACAEIRAGWTAEERAERWQGAKRIRWEFPRVALRDVFGDRVEDGEEA
jgi:hypothetical protein